MTVADATRTDATPTERGRGTGIWQSGWSADRIGQYRNGQEEWNAKLLLIWDTAGPSAVRHAMEAKNVYHMQRSHGPGTDAEGQRCDAAGSPVRWLRAYARDVARAKF